MILSTSHPAPLTTYFFSSILVKKIHCQFETNPKFSQSWPSSRQFEQKHVRFCVSTANNSQHECRECNFEVPGTLYSLLLLDSRLWSLMTRKDQYEVTSSVTFFSLHTLLIDMWASPNSLILVALLMMTPVPNTCFVVSILPSLLPFHVQIHRNSR